MSDSFPRVATWPQRRWASHGGTQACGYAVVDGTLLRADALATRIDRTPTAALPALLEGSNGFFAAVRTTGDGVLAIVDHVRSIPLLVVDTGQGHLITDDVDTAYQAVALHTCDWARVAELLTCLYVTGSETLLDGITQVDAGTFVHVRSNGAVPERHSWYRFRPHRDPRAAGDLVGQAHDTLRRAVVRTVEAYPAAQLVVPLSGGLDSLLIARLLAEVGVAADRVLTYTYDRPGGAEARTASALARSLGFQWEFVPHSHDTWSALARGEAWPPYLRWSSSLTSTPNPHDYGPMASLRDRGLVGDDAVVVPGHSGDTVSGSWLPGSLARARTGTRADVADALVSAHYRFRSAEAVGRLVGEPADRVDAALRSRLEASLPPSDLRMGPEDLTALAEEWVWRERQAKYIVNSVRVYEAHGLRVAMPWWDREVVAFWTHVPMHARGGLVLRQQLARSVGIGGSLSPWRARLEDHLARNTRRLGIEQPVKKARRAWRARRPGRTYAAMPQFGLVNPARFHREFTGRETPWAFLAEDTVRAVVPRAVVGSR